MMIKEMFSHQKHLLIEAFDCQTTVKWKRHYLLAQFKFASCIQNEPILLFLYEKETRFAEINL